MAVGTVTIDIGANTDKFDKQIANVEKKMEKTEAEKVEVDLEIKNIKDAKKRYDEANLKVKEYKNTLNKIKNAQKTLKEFNPSLGIASARAGMTGDIVTSYETSLKLASELRDKIAEQNNIRKEALAILDKEEPKLESLQEKQTQLTNEVTKYKNQIEGIKLQKQQSEINKVKEGFNNVGSSIQNAVKKAGKLALGIFAVRSAYMMLRRASSDLASYDDQYATNLEYIRFVLTQAIAPVLKYIVNLAATVLRYINMILNALFGINLFSNGSAENFNKMKNNASGVGKAVKEIKKQLTGFDEINVLTDQSDTGTSAGAGGVGMPDFDLSEIEGEPPEWMQWIADNKNLIIGALTGIATALVLLKFGITGLMNLGISIAIGGLVALIKDVVKWIDDPSWENFADILRDLAIVIAGVSIAMIAFNTTNPIGWIMLAIAAIVAVTSAIIKYWDEIKQTLFTVGNWINDNVIQPIVRFFQNMWERITSIFEPIGNWFRDRFSEAWQNIKNVFANIGNFFSGIWNTIKGIFTNIGQKIGDAVGGAFKSAVNAVMTIIENILNAPIRAINGLIGIINVLPGVNLSKIPLFNLPRLKVGGLVNMPNKGTLVGGAVAGESGREGVIPLTDQQAMAELGREIGKNVLINLTNVTSMNGRVISRELKQINNRQDFAYNT